MAWKFDAQVIDLRWVVEPEQIQTDGLLDFGAIESDISLDTGDRTADSSVIDQGVRIIDGNI